MWWFKRKMGTHGETDFMSPRNKRAIREARALGGGEGAVFHAQCIDCVWRKGNDFGEGLKHCQGCAFFNFVDFLPNLCIPLDTPR